ncbi:hypothetical protein [Candidatus Kuenenia sp.]|uniref:tetratricopeptide repeat protein n=1 Tax=Candidatus Kuenenia sp. TaxID=2499824 RepID=UPI0032203B7D
MLKKTYALLICTIAFFAFSTQTLLAQEQKYKIVIFPFVYNLASEGQIAGVERIVQSELIRSGLFSVIDQKRTYHYVRKTVLHNFYKIDDVEKGSNFSNKDIIDLFFSFEWEKVVKMTKQLNADFGIKGSLSQFGEGYRADIEVINAKEIEIVRLQEMKDKTVGALVGECVSEEKIPEMFEKLAQQIIGLCLAGKAQETAESIIKSYYQGKYTYQETENKLLALISDMPEEFILQYTLFSHYLENPEKIDRLIKTGEKAIHLFDSGNEEHIRYMSFLGLDLFLELANAYVSTGDFSKAITVYNHAVTVYHMNHAKYFKQLGVLYLLEDKEEASMNAFKKALNIDPADFESNFAIAALYEAKKNTAQALEQYRNCIKYATNPTDRSKVLEAIKKLEAKEPLR